MSKKVLLVALLTAALSGCKLGLTVSSGGRVESLSGTRDCGPSAYCEVEVTDKSFSEVFTAVAEEGYVFSKWQSGDGFICADSTNSTCIVSNTALPDNPIVNEIIAGGHHYYLMPLFDFVGIDTDGDGIKDHVDADDDNDGVNDENDDCPLVGPNTNGFGCPDGLISERVSLRLGYYWVLADYYAPLSDHDAVCAEHGYAATAREVTVAWDSALLSDLSADFGYASNGDDNDAAKSMWCFDENGSPGPTPANHCATHNFGTTYENYGAYGNARPVFTCVESTVP